MGEASQLRRMLQNLIDNASVHGAVQGEIQVSVAQRGAVAVLGVANDGASIAEEDEDKLFTPYYRLPGAGPGGHGLGLAIVKEIADQHEAGIVIRRKPDGQGTVIDVTLAMV